MNQTRHGSSLPTVEKAMACEPLTTALGADGLSALALLRSPRFQAAKKELLASISEQEPRLRGIRAGTDGPVRDAFRQAIQTFNKERGRDLFYPYLASGIGAGPFIELMDGSVKLDLITGIGIHFFGHSHPELMAEMIDAVPADIMQGNLQPGYEARALVQEMLRRTGPKSRLKHGWLMCSGTMSNEVALKIIRQKKAPATRVLAFEDCFAGRSTAMQEITDNPGYRQGQPLYGEVAYLPFYNAKRGLERSLELTINHLKWETHRYPQKYAALMIELVQGEGGFNSAPREWYAKVFQAARDAGLAVWVDEIQTFGRTGELFAFQKFGVEEFVDVVTVGKMLQACMVLYTDEYNPKPGLVAGTFSGSTVALRTARRCLELLDEEGHLGADGRIMRLSRRFEDGLRSLKDGSCKGLIGEIRAVGGMIAFEPFAGTQDEVKKVLMKLFDLGVIAFNCGHGPYLVRMLPPLPAMKEQEVDLALERIGAALVAVRDDLAAASSSKS